MKYIEALRIYNEGKNKWCMPKKGSSDYIKIKNMTDKPIVLKKAIKKNINVINKEKHNSSRGKSSKIYQSLSYKNKEIVDNLSNKPDIKKLSSNLFIQDKRIKKIQKFFKNYIIKNKYSIDNRIKYYKYISKYVNNINSKECIKKTFDNDKNEILSIDNTLFLDKKIGTESQYGVIYLTSLKNKLGSYLLASKVMADSPENKEEIKIMRYITKNIIVKKKSRHFAMIYKDFACNDIDLETNRRLISVNELAHGDLKTILGDRKILSNNRLLFNLLFQTFISIATFHNFTRYVHCDAHWGNFLYQKNKEVGHYEYVYNKKHYYLESCEYNIMIYDFGFSVKNKNQNYVKNVSDYLGIIHAFMNKTWGWGIYEDLPTPGFTNIMLDYKDVLMSYLEGGFDNNKSMTEAMIYEMFLTYPNNVFITNKPAKIINKTPFYIG